MPVSEAEKQLAELRAELAKERAVAAGGTRPENPGKIRGVRKTIARLLTVINEKKRVSEKAGIAKPAVEAGKAVAKQVSPGFSGKHKLSDAPQTKGLQGSAKAISQSFFPERKKGFSKEKKAVAHVAKTKAIIKKAVKGKAKKGVKRV